MKEQTRIVSFTIQSHIIFLLFLFFTSIFCIRCSITLNVRTKVTSFTSQCVLVSHHIFTKNTTWNFNCFGSTDFSFAKYIASLIMLWTIISIEKAIIKQTVNKLNDYCVNHTSFEIYQIGITD